MNAPVLEHVALKASDLGRTELFYQGLGGRTSRHVGGKRLFVELGGGSRLIFDAAQVVPDVGAITYLGLELPDFPAVDAAFARLASSAALGRDIREDYRTATGPYGFFVRDPDGYSVKVFKYNEGAGE